MEGENSIAENLFSEGKMEECKVMLTQILQKDFQNIQALILRSRVNYKLQKWGESLNDLNKVLELDEQNELAKNYKEMVMNILSYWNKDSYNP